jgi:hypothetical protein
LSTLLRRVHAGLFVAVTGLLCFSLIAPSLTLAGPDLNPGEEAVVANTNGDGATLRSGAGRDAAAISNVPEDTPVQITDGPVPAADGSLWYQVVVDGVPGYISVDYVEGGAADAAAESAATDEEAADTPDQSQTEETTEPEPAQDEPAVQGPAAATVPWQQPVAFGVVVNTTGSLPVDGITCRADAYDGSPVITELWEGNALEVTGDQVFDGAGGGWYPINCAGVGGFVSSAYVALDAPAEEEPVVEEEPSETTEEVAEEPVAEEPVVEEPVTTEETVTTEPVAEVEEPVTTEVVEEAVTDTTTTEVVEQPETVTEEITEESAPVEDVTTEEAAETVTEEVVEEPAVTTEEITTETDVTEEVTTDTETTTGTTTETETETGTETGSEVVEEVVTETETETETETQTEGTPVEETVEEVTETVTESATETETATDEATTDASEEATETSEATEEATAQPTETTEATEEAAEDTTEPATDPATEAATEPPATPVPTPAFDESKAIGSAEVQGTGGNGLKCHTAADAGSPTITILPEGANVIVMARPEGDWVSIACGGRLGFANVRCTDRLLGRGHGRPRARAGHRRRGAQLPSQRQPQRRPHHPRAGRRYPDHSGRAARQLATGRLRWPQRLCLRRLRQRTDGEQQHTAVHHGLW